MVRAGFRTKLALNFPPFAVQSRGQALVVAGGGGDSKTGVPNQIVYLFTGHSFFLTGRNTPISLSSRILSPPLPLASSCPHFSYEIRRITVVIVIMCFQILYRVKEGTFEELVAQDTGTKTIFGINFHPTVLPTPPLVSKTRINGYIIIMIFSSIFNADDNAT